LTRKGKEEVKVGGMA